jgi:hypothetical protein
MVSQNELPVRFGPNRESFITAGLNATYPGVMATMTFAIGRLYFPLSHLVTIYTHEFGQIFVQVFLGHPFEYAT